MIEGESVWTVVVRREEEKSGTLPVRRADRHVPMQTRSRSKVDCGKLRKMTKGVAAKRKLCNRALVAGFRMRRFNQANLMPKFRIQACCLSERITVIFWQRCLKLACAIVQLRTNGIFLVAEWERKHRRKPIEESCAASVPDPPVVD